MKAWKTQNLCNKRFLCTKKPLHIHRADFISYFITESTCFCSLHYSSHNGAGTSEDSKQIAYHKFICL